MRIWWDLYRDLVRNEIQNFQGCELLSKSGLYFTPNIKGFACKTTRFRLLGCSVLNYSRFGTAAAAAAKSLQSCPTLCDPIDGSQPGSPVPGILQARTLEWVAISFSNAWKRKVKGKLLSRVRLLATLWTAAYHAPPPMGFSRQEYWSAMPSPSLINRGMWIKSSQMEQKT